MKFAADLLLELADFLRKELHRTAAVRTDHVVMAAAIVLMLVAGNPVVKGHLAGQSALGQQLQRPVDGGVSDAGIFFLNQAMEFIGREMIAGLKKAAQDGIALGGVLQPDSLQMAM